VHLLASFRRQLENRRVPLNQQHGVADSISSNIYIGHTLWQKCFAPVRTCALTRTSAHPSKAARSFDSAPHSSSGARAPAKPGDEAGCIHPRTSFGWRAAATLSGDRLAPSEGFSRRATRSSGGRYNTRLADNSLAEDAPSEGKTIGAVAKGRVRGVPAPAQPPDPKGCGSMCAGNI
jgi:hypothetical protein